MVSYLRRHEPEYFIPGQFVEAFGILRDTFSLRLTNTQLIHLHYYTIQATHDLYRVGKRGGFRPSQEAVMRFLVDKFEKSLSLNYNSVYNAVTKEKPNLELNKLLGIWQERMLSS